MNWKSILASGIVTAIVTIGTGMLLFWWQAKEPKLSYNYIRSIPHVDSNGEQFSIHQVEISNSGNKTAEDVVLFIEFPGSEIEKSNIQIDSSIPHYKDIQENTVSLTLDNLNPEENLWLSVITKGSSDQIKEPNVSLRAKGITGIKYGSKAGQYDYARVIILVLGVYSGVIVILMSNRTFRTKYLSVASVLVGGAGKITGRQKEILASLLSRSGLPGQAGIYLNSSASRKYWVEADFLSATALESNDQNFREKILLVLLKLIEEIDMVSNSKAIVHYNAARVQQSLGQVFQNQLAEARKLDKEEIDRRMASDPVFT